MTVLSFILEHTLWLTTNPFSLLVPDFVDLILPVCSVQVSTPRGRQLAARIWDEGTGLALVTDPRPGSSYLHDGQT